MTYINPVHVQLVGAQQTPAYTPLQELYTPYYGEGFLQELAGQSDSYFRSKEYLAKTAQQKQNELWTEITRDTTPGSFPSPAVLAGLFTADMKKSFDTDGDAMPAYGILGTRTKFIHSVGTVGKVKFVSNGKHEYSGIFKGAQYGLIRMSSAAQPSSSQPLAPGFGLKFLRDKVDSANLVAMFGVNGTPGDWNFFKKDFTTHIGSAKGAALEAVACKFT